MLQIIQEKSVKKDIDIIDHISQELQSQNVENKHSSLLEDSVSPLKQTTKKVSPKIRTVSECATRDDRLNRV